MRRAIMLALFGVALVVFGMTSGGHGQNKDTGKPVLPPWFKKLDLDTDGQIAPWEWRHAGKKLSDFKKWDRDRDGFINREEAKRMYAAEKKADRRKGFPDMRAKNGKSQPVEDPLDARPVVYRAGKLPDAVLPPWFKKLDSDKDGQVAMWEWREARKDLDEFRQWDRDGDGFITPEEALKRFAEMTTRTLRLTEAVTEVKAELTADGSKSPFPPSKNCMLYRVKMNGGTTYIIDLESTAFDAYLSFADANMQHIASNDDGGGRLNARIRFECKEDGMYHIVATGLGNPKGEYLLRVTASE